jgi:hypothetical protein
MRETSGTQQSFMDHAIELEKRYDWLGAAGTYEEVLKSLPRTEPLRTGDILERRAYALYKRALQAESVEEFASSADRATEAYEEAKVEYLTAKKDGTCRARVSRCDGMLAFMRFLRAADADQRRKAACESWDCAKDSLDASASLDEMHEFCRTFYDLSLSAVYYSNLVPDYETRRKTWTEVTSRGERAAAFACTDGDQDLGIGILVLVAALLHKGGYCGLCDESNQYCHGQSINLWKKADSLSRDKALSNAPIAWVTGDAVIDPSWEAARQLESFRKALDLVRPSRDRLIIGHAHAAVSFFAHWIGDLNEDPEQVSTLMTDALESAFEAGREFRKIGFLAETGHNIWVMSPQADYAVFMARNEKDLNKRRQYSEEGLKAFPEYERLSLLTGYSWQTIQVSNVEGSLLWSLATTEAEAGTKRAMLEKGVDLIRTSVERLERWDSGNPYNLGIFHFWLSFALNDLAETTSDKDSRARVFREAILMGEKANMEYEEGIKAGHMAQDQPTVAGMAWGHDRLGRAYCSLSELEGDHDLLRHALKSYEKASELYTESMSPSMAAESLWKAARIYDQLEDHVRSGERFLSASKSYGEGAQKIPSLNGLFSEQATYLEAWSEFERAKHHHSRQEYQQALTHFEKAAHLHEGLDKWRFLSSNYRAWALTDKGEMLSREDRRVEAVKAFEEAADLFGKSAVALDEAGRKAEDADEKRMISRVLSASRLRREYCLARVMIEKARQMDVDGMSSSSSEIYRTAADELERLAAEAPSERDRKDIRLLAVISRAWQKMNQAEAEISPEPYADAAMLFEEAKELSTNDKAKALSLGHSRFCRALEAGTKFADTRESAQHTAAVKSLESASSFYVKAGADRCSEYARASKLLFDAYAYLAEAGQEKDQEKAAKMYARAEKVLQVSSDSYERAGQAGKRDQVQKLLDRVKRERELAVSLMEVFEAPTGASSTAAFGALMPSQEEAVGLDRFAHADIQAALIIKRNDIRIGEDVSVEIELVNAGRASAQLTKVENIIPAGFDVLSKPATYRIEDSYIMMKGKRLDPLKTEEIALVLRPKVQGRFTIRPRILYIDDEGSYKVREVEGAQITVKELGVAGWLKGPERGK